MQQEYCDNVLMQITFLTPITPGGTSYIDTSQSWVRFVECYGAGGYRFDGLPNHVCSETTVYVPFTSGFVSAAGPSTAPEPSTLALCGIATLALVRRLTAYSNRP